MCPRARSENWSLERRAGQLCSVIPGSNATGAAVCFCAQNCILVSYITEGVWSFLVEHQGSTFQRDQLHGCRRRGQLYLALLQLCLPARNCHQEASNCNHSPPFMLVPSFLVTPIVHPAIFPGGQD